MLWIRAYQADPDKIETYVPHLSLRENKQALAYSDTINEVEQELLAILERQN